MTRRKTPKTRLLRHGTDANMYRPLAADRPVACFTSPPLERS